MVKPRLWPRIEFFSSGGQESQRLFVQQQPFVMNEEWDTTSLWICLHKISINYKGKAATSPRRNLADTKITKWSRLDDDAISQNQAPLDIPWEKYGIDSITPAPKAWLWRHPEETVNRSKLRNIDRLYSLCSLQLLRIRKTEELIQSTCNKCFWMGF